MRNPLSWRNVNTTVSSNPNLALKVFQESNNNLIGAFKDIYDRKREANTIDAMEKIRAGEPIGTDYGGVVDKKALLDFSIKQEQLKRQERLDNARLDRLSQVMSLAKAEENRKKQTFPISLEAARLQNKKVKFENSNLQDTYNLSKELTKSRIDLNEAKATKAQRTDSLEDIKTKIASSNYDNQTEIKNLRDEYVATQQAISDALKDNNYKVAKTATNELEQIKQEIAAKSSSIKGLEPTRGETANLYNMGFSLYTNTFKNVPLTDKEKLAIASKSKKVLNKSDYVKQLIDKVDKRVKKTKYNTIKDGLWYSLGATLNQNKEISNIKDEIRNNKDKYYKNYLLDEVNKGHIEIPKTKSIRREPTDEDFLKQGINMYDPTIKASVYKGIADAKNKAFKEGIDRLVKLSKQMKENKKKQYNMGEAIRKLSKQFDVSPSRIKAELYKNGIQF